MSMYIWYSMFCITCKGGSVFFETWVWEIFTAKARTQNKANETPKTSQNQIQ